MAAPRGKAFSQFRPGIIVKGVLTGNIPLETRNTIPSFVSEACVTDLHQTYKAHLYRENLNRPKVKRLKGMTYESFAKWFRFSRYMGLVEKVREEPANMPKPMSRVIRTPAGKLSIRRTSRIIYRLTDLGRTEERAWQDLASAWREWARGEWDFGQPALVPEYKRPEVEVKNFEGRTPDEDAFWEIGAYIRDLARIVHLTEEAQEPLVDAVAVVSDWVNRLRAERDNALDMYRGTGNIGWKETADVAEDWLTEIQKAMRMFNELEFESGANVLIELGRKYRALGEQEYRESRGWEHIEHE